MTSLRGEKPAPNCLNYGQALIRPYYYYYYYARGDIALMHLFPVQAYCALKSCISLLENVSLRVPTRHVRDFSKFSVCPSNEHCPSARCAYAANAVGKDLDIFAIGAVSLNHIL
jgi:hypothetical protein